MNDPCMDRKEHHPLRLTLLATAITSLFSTHVFAATEPEQAATTEDTVVVTASVIENSQAKDVKEYPGTRTVISSEQIKKTAANSIGQALQSVPGIKIQDETGTGVLPNVSVRGLTASRSGYAQFLMDGVPLTLAPYGHTGQSLFPATLSTIDRIDIVRGGAAVQYGPNNVGGVINLVTKPIPDKWQTEINNRLTMFEDGNTPLNDIYLRTGGWVNDHFALQLEGDFLKGDSFRDHSDTDVKNFQLKTKWLLSETQELQGFIQRYDADTEMPGALSLDAYQQDRTQSQRPYDQYRGKSTRWSVKYLQDLEIADSAEFDLLTFGHRSERFFQWGYNSTSGQNWADPAQDSTHVRTSPRDFTVYGIEPKLAMYFGEGRSVTQNWIIGMRYVNEDINYQLTQTPVSGGSTSVPRDWHLDTDAYAGYVSNEIGLFNDTLKVTPGIRYERVDMTFNDIGNSQSADNSITEWLPGLTIAYNLTEDWVGYTNAQRSLRAPQIANIRGLGKEGSELAWDYELGLRYTTDSSSFNVALYRIDYRDQLQWQGATQTFENIGKTLHKGIEVSGRHTLSALPSLSVGANYTYLDATIEEGTNKGNKLPYASRHQLSWDATYGYNGVETTLSGFYFSDAYSDNANTSEENSLGSVGKLPSYVVWNANLGTDLYKDEQGTLRLNVAVNNLFDRDYYFRGIDVSPVGRYPAPGRSYSLDLNYQF